MATSAAPMHTHVVSSSRQFFSPLDGQTVALINVKSGTALTLANGSSENGAPVVGLKYAAAEYQHWTLVQIHFGKLWPAFSLVNVASGTVLSLKGESRADRTPVHGWRDYQRPAQLWHLFSGDAINARVLIQNASTGTVVDIDGGRPEDNTPVFGYNADHALMNGNQIWEMRFIDPPEAKSV